MNMRELSTQIDINASPEKVWGILTDKENIGSWNPFIKKMNGDLEAGNQIEVLLQQPGSKPMKFTPKVIEKIDNRKFCWKGKLLFKGLFDGEHIFELQEIDDNKTKFTQREIFSGLLVPFLWKSLDKKTRLGFEQMNSALKKRAESI